MGNAAEEPGTGELSETMLVVGSGAMGVLFAARLAAAGIAVGVLSEWAEGIAALTRDGACLSAGPDGSRQCYPVHASANPADFAGVRSALVLVKAWQTHQAAEALTACLHPDGLALTLQNGLGNRETMVDALGSERVAAGVTTLGASLLSPGVALPGGEGRIALEAHPRISHVLQLFAAAGLVARVEADLPALLWDKLVINTAVNPVTALLGLRNGQVLEIEPALDLALTAGREAAQIAAALSIALPYTDPAARVREVLRNTASNSSSMLQDVQRGAPTEIEAITGSVVHAAAHAGLTAPVNQALYRLVTALVAARTAGLRK